MTIYPYDTKYHIKDEFITEDIEKKVRNLETRKDKGELDRPVKWLPVEMQESKKKGWIHTSWIDKEAD